MQYKPTTAFTVPMILLTPTYSTVNGVRVKEFQPIEDGLRFNGSFKTYGGTETNINNILVIEDTADVETWFSPMFKSNCEVVVATTGARYEIISEPENINQANQYCKFKCKRVKGGV